MQSRLYDKVRKSFIQAMISSVIVSFLVIFLSTNSFADVTTDTEEIKNGFAYSAKDSSGDTVARGTITLSEHKRNFRKKYFSYSVSIKIKDYPYLEEPPINVDFDIHHFGNDGLRAKLRGEVYDKIKAKVNDFTNELGIFLEKHKGYYSECSGPDDDACLKNKIDKEINRLLRLYGKTTFVTDVSADLESLNDDVGENKQKEILEALHKLINKKEQKIETEYEVLASEFTSETIGIISEFYEGDAADQVAASGTPSHVRLKKVGKGFIIVGKAVFNILWKGVTTIPSGIKLVVTICKEAITAVNELIKLAKYWGDLAEKEDAYLTYYYILDNFKPRPQRTLGERSGTGDASGDSCPKPQGQNKAASLSLLIQQTEEAYKDYEESVMLISKKRVQSKIDNAKAKMNNAIATTSKRVLPEIRNSRDYATIMKLLDRNQYVLMQQLTDNLNDASDAIENFRARHKRSYLTVMIKQQRQLDHLHRTEQRKLGHTSKGISVRNWLKKHRDEFETIFSNVEKVYDLLDEQDDSWRVGVR